MSSRIPPVPSDLSTFDQAPAFVDQVARTAMRSLSDEQQQRSDALQLERQRLSAKYGADSPQVASVAQRLELHDQVNVAIKVQKERFDLRTPDTSTDSLIVYGRVVDTAGEGLGGLTVSAIDEKAKIVATTETDDGGGFELPILTSAFTRKVASGAVEVEGTKEGLDEQADLRLQISDARKRTLYRDQEVFQPTPGKLSYREIVLAQPRPAPKIDPNPKIISEPGNAS